MRLRRTKGTEILFEDLDHPGSDNEAPRDFGASDTSMFGVIDRLNLRRAVCKLPSGYRRFFLLYDVFGYEHHEIAQRLGCSTGCSKSQLHKARRQLRRLLQEERCVAREANVAAA
jgi:DNA-directed RNA polymerase specialized sigma24 family protein